MSAAIKECGFSFQQKSAVVKILSMAKSTFFAEGPQSSGAEKTEILKMHATTGAHQAKIKPQK